MKMLALALCPALAVAQSQPMVSSDGVNVSVTTGPSGYLQINGVRAATMADVSNAGNDVSADVDLLSNQVQTVTAGLSAAVSSLQSTLTQSQQCISTGQLWDATQQQCVSPLPSSSLYATAARMLAAEQDIDGIESQLNQTAGTHSVCTICGRNQYVSAPCTAQQGTQCTNCQTGSYSRGGYAEQCIACAASVTNCGYATCTNANDASCQYCRQTVEDGAAYRLSGTNQCTMCPRYTYRASNTTCTACPKDATCAAASCQANSGLTLLTGAASMSSVYLGALNGGLSIDQYLARWTDGVTTFNPVGPHSGEITQNGDLNNPWFQVDLGASTQLAGIYNLVLWNRDGAWSCRLFSQNGGQCPGAVQDASRVWDGANEGAFLGVSNTPLTTTTTNVPANACTAGATNCRCGALTRYNTTNNGQGPYTVSCNGAVGRYVYLFLPGTNRMLNFAELEIWGMYQVTSPSYSFCAVPCTLTGCAAGNARCSGGLNTARCVANGCVSTVSGGVAFGYNSGTGQCDQCTSSQYRNAQGVCQQCPSSCGGQPCQTQNPAVSGFVPSHGPVQYNNLVAGLAVDTSMTTYSETGTTTNPYWQANLGSATRVVSVQIRNRQDNCGARLFNGGNQCQFGIVVPGSTYDQDYNGATQGATIRVGNAPCVNGQNCPGTVCGRLTRPSTTGWDYTVTCSTPITGSYVSIQLPGNGRILQLANVVINQDTTQPTC